MKRLVQVLIVLLVQIRCPDSQVQGGEWCLTPLTPEEEEGAVLCRVALLTVVEILSSCLRRSGTQSAPVENFFIMAQIEKGKCFLILENLSI